MDREKNQLMSSNLSKLNQQQQQQTESALAAMTNRLKRQIDQLFRLVNRQNVCLKRTNRFRNYLKTVVAGNNIDTEKFNCEFRKYEQNYSVCWKRCRKLNRKLLGRRSSTKTTALYDTLYDLLQSLTIVDDLQPTVNEDNQEVVCFTGTISSLTYECQIRYCRIQGDINIDNAISKNCSSENHNKVTSSKSRNKDKTTSNRSEKESTVELACLLQKLDDEVHKIQDDFQFLQQEYASLKSTNQANSTESSSSTTYDDIGTDQSGSRSKRRKFVDKKLRCEVEGCTYSAKLPYLLANHMLVHSEEKPFGCEVEGCDFRTKTIQILKNHQATHRTDRPFECEQCGKCFKSKTLMNTHRKTHRTERFQCEYEECLASYKVKKDLNKHVRKVHTKELKPFSCDWPNCKYTTFQTEYLKEHRYVHTGERPNICVWPDCDKTFKTKSGLFAHNLMHKNERRYKCQSPGCNYSCNLLGNLHKHEAIHQQRKQNIK